MVNQGNSDGESLSSGVNCLPEKEVAFEKLHGRFW